MTCCSASLTGKFSTDAEHLATSLTPRSDPEPRYVLKHPDPSKPVSKNVYAAALVDAYVPDVVYGEVLIRPQWTQPNPTPEDIKKNGSVPPAPVPIIPQDFTIQLYGPDQQIVVTEKPAGFAGTPTYHFTMPQHTFRTPSGSTLDRIHDDPGLDVTTPKIQFTWKKDGKFAKDLTCSLTGRSTDNASKKKGGKEPHITVALFSGYRDLAVYEPNLHRVEMEDFKGLEVVLLLSAAVIRDIYCGQKKDCFSVGVQPRKSSGGLIRRKSNPSPRLQLDTQDLNGATRPPEQIIPNGVYSTAPGTMDPRRNTGPQQPRPPPPADPRAQWEIEAETARLRTAQATEQKSAEKRRKAQEKADQEEAKRMQKQLDVEDKERRKRQAEIDRETERLRRQYGDQSSMFPALPPRPQPPKGRQSVPNINAPGSGPSNWQQRPPQPPQGQNGPYLQAPNSNIAGSLSSFFTGRDGASGQPQQQQPQQQQPAVKPKRSFLGLRSVGGDENPQPELLPTVQRKRSSLW